MLPGDELCICYSADETKLWFLPSGERPRARTPSDDGDGSERLAALVFSEDEGAAERAAAKERVRETRRAQGGSTHSAKEQRRAKWRAKMEKRAEAEVKILAPQPVPAQTALLNPEGGPSASGSCHASSAPSTSYAVLPMTERATDDLPALSSENSRRHEHTAPAAITNDLDWVDSGAADVPEANWGLVRRAKGPVEIEEEAEDDNAAMSTFSP